jgi:glycosyltransferase involved in cell wall biosynthesis
LSRLGIYVDAVFHVDERDEQHVRVDPVDYAFLLFGAEVGERFDRLVLFGRTRRGVPPPDLVPFDSVELARLPHYDSLRDFGGMVRAAGGTIRGLLHGLSGVDVVWVIGPHPYGFALIGLALIRGKRVVLGVRQDTINYYRARLPSRRSRLLLVGVWTMDGLYRLLARSLRTTVVGQRQARRYGGDRGRVLTMNVSLVRAADVVSFPAARDWAGTIQLLTVGRLEPEKNPLLLVEVLALLEAEHPDRYRLTWVGEGRLREAVLERAKALRVEHALELRGFIPYGPALLELYRRAHAFVHVSLTEGVPQVLFEALASGTAIVATDVGDVRTALDDGEAGLLVGPRSAEAVAASVCRLTHDAELRNRLIGNGLELAGRVSLEVESERVARFLADDSARQGR